MITTLTSQARFFDCIPSIDCYLENIPVLPYHEGVHVHHGFKNLFQPTHVVSACVCWWQSHTGEEVWCWIWHLQMNDKYKNKQLDTGSNTEAFLQMNSGFPLQHLSIVTAGYFLYIIVIGQTTAAAKCSYTHGHIQSGEKYFSVYLVSQKKSLWHLFL